MNQDWVKQSVTAGGAGNLTLGAAADGFIDFNTAIGQGPRFHYQISDGNNRERGIGYLSASTTLVREVVTATLAGGSYGDSSPGPITVTTNAFVMIAPSSDSGLEAAFDIAMDYDGNKYIPDALAISGATVGGLANRFFMASFFLPTKAVVTGLTFECSVGASGGAMIGIYQSINKSSAILLRQNNAALDTSTAGIKAGSFASPIKLNPGFWMIGVHVSSAPTLRTEYAGIGHMAALSGATSYYGARYGSISYSTTMPDTVSASQLTGTVGSKPRVYMIGA